jgi:predicted dinucleotide-utilizing enzyme
MIKITLDASALEYLMKQGGEEFQLQIKQAALNEACHRILTAITPNDLLREVEGKARWIAEEVVKGRLLEYKRTDSFNGRWMLKDEFVQSIKDNVVKEANELITKEASREAILEYVDSKIKDEVDYIKKVVDATVKRELTKALIENTKAEISAKLSEF